MFIIILFTILSILIIFKLWIKFKELSYSQQEDSSWVSKLSVNIPTPPQLNVGNTEISNEIQKNDKSENDINSTDIIPLLTEPTILTQSIMETDLRYPKGCSFYFEGFNGVKDYQRLKKFLIDSACNTVGTRLTVGIHDEFSNKLNS